MPSGAEATDVQISTDRPVLVTGATGYVAGWIVRKLLEAGATVHAAVRDPGNQPKVGHLHNMASQLSGEIRFYQADLLDQGSYAEAMQGCGVVLHTASPFTIDVSDPQKQLIDPALEGTRNVLEQASATPSVGRVVLTSSAAAMYTDAADLADLPGGTLTEDAWNTTASLDYQPYSYSKTLAEKEAWKIAEAQDRWRLVVINPTLVIGPGTSDRATSESFNIVKQMGDGTMRRGAPRYAMGAVDVREVADAHLAAAFKPEASGRHIVSAHNTDFMEMASTLAPRFGEDYPIPRRHLPKWLLWLVGPLVNKQLTRRSITRNVDVPFKADSSKSIRELGIEYRPLQESMVEMFAQMIEAGYFAK